MNELHEIDSGKLLGLLLKNKKVLVAFHSHESELCDKIDHRLVFYPKDDQGQPIAADALYFLFREDPQ